MDVAAQRGVVLGLNDPIAASVARVAGVRASVSSAADLIEHDGGLASSDDAFTGIEAARTGLLGAQTPVPFATQSLGSALGHVEWAHRMLTAPPGWTTVELMRDHLVTHLRQAVVHLDDAHRNLTDPVLVGRQPSYRLPR